MLSLLEKAGSRFSVLYSSSFPKKENVFSFWQKHFGQMSVFDYDELSMLEPMQLFTGYTRFFQTIMIEFNLLWKSLEI